MMSLLPFSESRDMVWEYLPELHRPLFRFYYFLLAAAGIGLITLFWYRIPVSIPVTGIVRPVSERTDVHPPIAGIIERMYVKEGDTVAENGLLFTLKDVTGPAEAEQNEKELIRQQELVYDLQKLTGAGTIGEAFLSRLKTALYREQAAAYLSKEAGEMLTWTGSRHETDIGRSLAKDKVISPKEFYDLQLREGKMRATVLALHQVQWAAWQADLLEHQQTLATCVSRKIEFLTRAAQTGIRAPLAGIVLGVRSWYAGCSVRPEQSVCTISPEGDLVGECYVSSRSAGLLRPGQRMRIRVDGFSSNQSGILRARIASVSNDISFIENKPAFTVRCLFDQKPAVDNAGYRGILKKGLSFQGRCIVTERTLFQLLYERIEDWFNPASLSS